MEKTNENKPMQDPNNKGSIVEELEKEIKDLKLDLASVVDINRVCSIRYQEMLDCLPKAAEIDLILASDNYIDPERILKLKKFKSACVALEKFDPTIKPKKYDELQQEKSE